MHIAELLTITKNQEASDLHLTVGSPPALRIHGSIRQTDLPALDKETLHELLYEILTEHQKARYEEEHDLDFSIELEGVARFRVNAYVTRRGPAAAFRLIPERISSLDELGLPSLLGQLTSLERGIVLLTGPTGSGKSTTLAALIDIINQRDQRHIITLEDPIEYVHKHLNSIVDQREVGAHTHSFANGLRSALREDPDVILVGEMRDLDTIQLALRAGETGHLVFSTLHTNSAAKTIDRIIDVFPPDQQDQVRIQISEIIEGVVSQTLVPTTDNLGRAVACEIMFAVPAIRNLIRESKTFQIPTTIQLGTQDGMQSLDQSLVQLVKQGRISREMGFQKAYNRENFERILLGKRGE